MAAQDHSEQVGRHYGRHDLAGGILELLRRAGKDSDHLTPDDLAPIDQLHTGGRTATRELAQLAKLQAEMDVLDVGGGLGGPARTLATEIGCRVTVLDLTEAFCRAGELLTAATGLSDRVHHQQGDALAMPYADASFDAVWTQHSSMNIEDKQRLYAEIRRVLRPGGVLAMHEIMAGASQPIHFPVPWAAEPAISHLRPPEAVRAAILAADFEEVAWSDVTAAAITWFQQVVARQEPAPSSPSVPGTATALSMPALFGAEFATAIRNNASNFAEGRIVAVQGVFRRR